MCRDVHFKGEEVPNGPDQSAAVADGCSAALGSKKACCCRVQPFFDPIAAASHAVYHHAVCCKAVSRGIGIGIGIGITKECIRIGSGESESVKWKYTSIDGFVFFIGKEQGWDHGSQTCGWNSGWNSGLGKLDIQYASPANVLDSGRFVCASFRMDGKEKSHPACTVYKQRSIEIAFARGLCTA